MKLKYNSNYRYFFSKNNKLLYVHRSFSTMIFIHIILNFYYNILNFKTLIMFSYVVFGIFFFNESFYLISDLGLRINLNDFFFNNYFYYWTSFWYIPLSFFLLIFLYLNISFFKIAKNYLILVSLILTVMSIRVFDYWNTNMHFNYIILNGELLNILLFNSVNKYHPVMLYLSISILVVTVITCNSTFNLKLLWLTNYNKSQIIISKLTNLLLIITTLFLGSWWALQEGSWGGWWNWDPSELVGLFIMLNIIFLIHLKLNNHVTAKNIVHLTLFAVIISYTFTQLNFNLISHNFGLKVDDINSTLLMYYVTLVNFLLALIYFIYKTFRFLARILVSFFKIQNFQYDTKVIFKVVCVLSLTLISIFSFNILISDFIWKLTRINIIPNNINDLTLHINFIIFCFLCIIRISSIQFILLISLLYVTTQPLLILCVLVIFQKSTVNMVHLMIFSFVNLVFISKMLTSYLSSVLFLENYLEYSNINILPLNFSLESNLVEVFHIKFFRLYRIQAGLITYVQNTTTELNEFLMLFDLNKSLQILLNGKFNNLIFTSVSDYQINNLLTIKLLLILMTIKLVNTKKLIIF